MKDKAKEEFKERVLRWAEKIKVPVTGITFRRMKTKWASFSTRGRLTFDLKLLELAPEIQDYVIVHELLHYHVPNHGRVWKSLMIVYLGDYKRLESMLKRVLAKV